MRASNEEFPLVVPLHVEISPELKNALGQLADQENIPLNHLVHRLLAKALKRPEFTNVPAKRVGRPRKQLQIAK
jgi:hypothetical protein